MTDTGMKVWRDAKHAWATAPSKQRHIAAAAVITAAMADDKARIVALERELRVLKGPTPDEVETVQRASERGWVLPIDPPDWIDMTDSAAAFLTTLEAPSHD